MSHIQRPKTILSRYGGWLPSHPAIHESFLDHHVGHARRKVAQDADHSTAAVQAFGAAIKADPEMVALFEDIFDQASGENKITSLDMLLHAFDNVVEKPPAFHIAEDDDGNVIGEPVGVPLYVLFDLLGNTTAAYDLFRKPAFNVELKKLLDSWGEFLTTPASAKCLHDGPEGWFSSAAISSMEAGGRGRFEDTWVCPDPSLPSKGYKSWDEFFIRKYIPGTRPLIPASDPARQDFILYSACESTVYHITDNVKRHDRFWLKAQTYSIQNMIRDPEMARAHLRTIVRADVIPGTYYAVLPDEGAPEDDPDLKPGQPHGAMIRSQGWLTTTSSRAIIYIQSDNPDIGLMVFIGVGMAEVSTTSISVNTGDRVQAGDELGCFRFGGSSHALIFGPQIDIKWADGVEVDKHQLVHSVIGEIHLKN
ncbi:unnamed protein product [Mycena citricolor]|uniref:L-tryptophan decarboxylase PsiD-like domain-containing protein n=1 Tax=Mycena citricolor TaxID=2018698 RepID=A0AAD2H2X0_9AGAR|nr:unnamed protein product [Mycena citricolor]